MHLPNQLVRLLNDEVSARHADKEQVIFEARREVIAKIQSSFRRVVAYGIHASVSHAPILSKQLLNKQLAFEELEFIGAGAFSTVYRHGNEVLKVGRDTINRPMKYQEIFIEKAKQRQNPIVENLGNVAVAQNYDIEPYPLYPQLPSVVARQPYTPYTPLSLFALASHESRSVRKATREFAYDAYNMSKATGFVPNIHGSLNMGLTIENELVLVDPLGVHPDLDDPVQVGAMAANLRRVIFS